MSGSNLRFPKTFVFNPATEMVTSNAVKPNQLTLGQVGFFRSDTLVGIGATPSPTLAPGLQIHQNLGDNSFGTVRSKVIFAQRVKRWFGFRQTAPTAQIMYIGYDEVDAAKTITIKKGQDVTVTINVYNQMLQLWYGKGAYTKRIPVELALCDMCVADCTLLDPAQAAQLIADAINGVTPANQDWTEGGELKNFMTASVVSVTTGTGGSAVTSYGVKVVGVLPAEKTLNGCDPKDFYEGQISSFTIGLNNECAKIPVTKSADVTPGSGYAAMVANYERESQGYDRVRDQFEHSEFMKLHNFVIRAQAGTKYDFYVVEFDHSKQVTGVQTNERTEPYSVVFWVPTGTGANLEALFNSWLTPLGVQAVNVASGTVTGSTAEIENA